MFAFTLLTSYVFAVDLNVRIFSSSQLKVISITPLSGKYIIYNKTTKIVDLYKNNSVELSIKDGKISILKQNENLGSYDSLYFSADGFINTFTLKSIDPDIKERIYDDGIKLYVENNFFKVINKVEIEHYIAGVVESEGGIKKNLEFLKLQAIISRTYAICNIRKHLKEDEYNLCDNTHCQLYRGRSSKSMIMMATSQTAGDIIIDISNKPISAAFHSNCGGQTMNSEDIWAISTTYLKSVKDTFCLKQSQAKWVKKISKKEWLTYLLSKYNYNIEDSDTLKRVTNFTQNNREVYFDNNTKIPLKTIRQDWKFRSAFFSIENQGDTLLFKGRGYGHGVGLCQEGAMRMIDLGWTLKKIIKYYYKDVSIINIAELKPK
ncbi:MAG: SpoIID/LytB domain-containing protein [Bacteroidetes bacterium]|nr:SpoIID/LytB domain-containing protein [Bacteroidota bacterium]